MRLVYVMLAGILVTGELSGQVFDHSDQPSFVSTYSAVAPLGNGNWYAAEWHHDSIWFFASTVRELGADGQIINQWPVVFPGHEVDPVNDLILRDDGMLLVVGYGSGCDVWSPDGFMYLLDQGVVQWQKSYPSRGLLHAAENDSMVAIAHRDGLLFTDHEGDSLNSVDYPGWDYPQRVCRTTQGFVGMGFTGARQVLPDGTFSDSLVGVHVHDIVQVQSGELLAITEDSLLELTSDLQRTGLGVRVTGFGPRRVTTSGGMVHALTLDTLFSFTSDLVQLNAVATDQPWSFTGPMNEFAGFWPNVMEFGADHAMTAGGYRSEPTTTNTGVTYAACRTIPLEGPIDALQTNAELKNMTVDDLSFTQSGDYAYGTGLVRVWLLNRGNAPLTSITLNYTIQAVCGMTGTRQTHDTLFIAPGDSIQLAFGPFGIQEFLGQSDTMEICVLSARPNHRIDSDEIGNKVCTDVPISINTSSREPIDTQYHLFHPNPVTDQVVLVQGSLEHGPFEISFTDLRGRLSTSKLLSYHGGQMSIDIRDLSPGTYIAVVHQNDHRSTHRLVVE